MHQILNYVTDIKMFLQMNYNALQRMTFLLGVFVLFSVQIFKKSCIGMLFFMRK